MKKILIIAAVLITPCVLCAQEESFFMRDENIKIISSIVVLIIMVGFILGLIRVILDSRLKSKLIEKGVSDNIVEKFLRPGDTDTKTQALKWFLMLAGTGVGLTIIYYTLPLGIHSVAILAFSIAFSFLGYFFYLKRTEK